MELAPIIGPAFTTDRNVTMSGIIRTHAVEDNPDEIMLVTQCPYCSKEDFFVVSKSAYDAWRAGLQFVQNAFPHLNADEREKIMTGIDNKCWDEIMGKEQ
jgi:hypothetical protein